MAPIAATAAKHILPKGLACANCKARKVRCDAIKPACTACRRSARFRGEDASLVRCCYQEGKRCGGGGKAKRVKTSSTASSETESTSDVPSKAPQGIQQTPLGEAINTTLQLPEPIEQASSASLPLASTSTFTRPSSMPPLPPPNPLPQNFDLPAPIPLHPSTLPSFLNADPFALPPPPVGNDLDNLLRTFALPAESIPYTSQPQEGTFDASAFPSEEPWPSSPSSASSLSSFFSDGSASSSLLGSPFSLCEDFELAFKPSYPLQALTPPPLALPAATPSAFPSWTAYPSAEPYAYDDAFLPTAHDCDKTLALPLFDSRWAPSLR
ncbi:hypothetical protein JCM6882_002447 [Rhodosporidiobolus microsporus]